MWKFDIIGRRIREKDIVLFEHHRGVLYMGEVTNISNGKITISKFCDTLSLKTNSWHHYLRIGSHPDILLNVLKDNRTGATKKVSTNGAYHSWSIDSEEVFTESNIKVTKTATDSKVLILRRRV